MPDDAVVDVAPTCETCGGRGVVPRLYDSATSRRPRSRTHIRAAALVACPTCTTPRDIER